MILETSIAALAGALFMELDPEQEIRSSVLVNDILKEKGCYFKSIGKLLPYTPKEAMAFDKIFPDARIKEVLYVLAAIYSGQLNTTFNVAVDTEDSSLNLVVFKGGFWGKLTTQVNAGSLAPSWARRCFYFGDYEEILFNTISDMGLKTKDQEGEIVEDEIEISGDSNTNPGIRHILNTIKEAEKDLHVLKGEREKKILQALDPILGERTSDLSPIYVARDHGFNNFGGFIKSMMEGGDTLEEAIKVKLMAKYKIKSEDDIELPATFYAIVERLEVYFMEEFDLEDEP